MQPRRNSARALLLTYLVVAAVAVLAELFDSPLANVAGWFTMPLLAEMVLVSTNPPRPRPVVLVMAALGLFFLADLLSDLLFVLGDEPAGLLVLLGLLTLAQACYVAAFWRLWHSAAIRASPRWLIGYGLLFVVGVVAVRAGAGSWFWALMAYGAVVTATAVLAHALEPSAAFGGTLFFASAALATLYRFAPGWDKPVVAFWIALTLLSAQALIALGVVRRWQAELPAPAPREVAGATIE